MVGQPGINGCPILDNFRKKALSAYLNAEVFSGSKVASMFER